MRSERKWWDRACTVLSSGAGAIALAVSGGGGVGRVVVVIAFVVVGGVRGSVFVRVVAVVAIMRRQWRQQRRLTPTGTRRRRSRRARSTTPPHKPVDPTKIELPSKMRRRALLPSSPLLWLPAKPDERREYVAQLSGR
ncbi:hypothetical protein C0992_001888 [Termitomyces sp. T32_za158]|nr:hypothetical protein C0992_001888 [Termitomyces sp. T32_za158]